MISKIRLSLIKFAFQYFSLLTKVLDGTGRFAGRICFCLAFSVSLLGTTFALEQQKGVILKITDSGKRGNVVANPLGEKPQNIVDELNTQGITEIRLQVNNGKPMSSIIEAGSKVVDLLAVLGFKGKVILDNKQWHLQEKSHQDDWVSAMFETYKAASVPARRLIGGFSFGETTDDEEYWDHYANGVSAAVGKLAQLFNTSDDPHFLVGKRFYVGGTSLNGSFRLLNRENHQKIKDSIDGVGGQLIYAYKSFHSRKGLPDAKSEDLKNKANAKSFLQNIAGLQNLAMVAQDTEVQYRGDAGDSIPTE